MKCSYNLLFIIIILFATLRSFLWNGLSPLSLLAFVASVGFVIVNYSKTRVSSNYLKYSLVIILSFCFIYSGTIFYEIDIDPKRLIGLNIVFVTLIISPFLVGYFNSGIFKAVVSIHLFFFYVQFVAYYVLGDYIEFFVFNENSSRNLGGVFTVPIVGLPLMRASGLFSEPGTYSNFMFLLYILHNLCSTKEEDALNGGLYALFISSLVLSFSTFGLVFACVIILSRLKSLKSLVIPVVLIFTVAAPYFVYRFVDSNKNESHSSIDFRYKYINDATSNFETVEGWVVGKGALSVPVFFMPGEGSDNDSGLIFFILREMGVIIALVLLLSVFYMQLRNGLSLLMTACLFTKLTPFSFFIPLLFAVYFFKRADLVHKA